MPPTGSHHEISVGRDSKPTEGESISNNASKTSQSHDPPILDKAVTSPPSKETEVAHNEKGTHDRGKTYDDVDLESGARRSSSTIKPDEDVHTTAVDPNIVDWDGPNDPNNAMNWSKGMKYGNIAVLATITFLTYATTIALLIDSPLTREHQPPRFLHVRSRRATGDEGIPLNERRTCLFRRLHLRIGLLLRASLHCTTFRAIRSHACLPRLQPPFLRLHHSMRRREQPQLAHRLPIFRGAFRLLSHHYWRRYNRRHDCAAKKRWSHGYMGTWTFDGARHWSCGRRLSVASKRLAMGFLGYRDGCE